jgi:hypothetical protein
MAGSPSIKATSTKITSPLLADFKLPVKVPQVGVFQVASDDVQTENLSLVGAVDHIALIVHQQNIHKSQIFLCPGRDA